MTAYIPDVLHIAVKIKLIQQGKQLSVLVEELLTTWVNNPP